MGVGSDWAYLGDQLFGANSGDDPRHPRIEGQAAAAARRCRASHVARAETLPAIYGSMGRQSLPRDVSRRPPLVRGPLRYPPLKEQLDTAVALEFEGHASCSDPAAGAPQSPPTMPKAWAPSAPSDRALWVRQTPAKSTRRIHGQGCGLDFMANGVVKEKMTDSARSLPIKHRCVLRPYFQLPISPLSSRSASIYRVLSAACWPFVTSHPCSRSRLTAAGDVAQHDAVMASWPPAADRSRPHIARPYVWQAQTGVSGAAGVVWGPGNG